MDSWLTVRLGTVCTESLMGVLDTESMDLLWGSVDNSGLAVSGLAINGLAINGLAVDRPGLSIDWLTVSWLHTIG